MITRFNILFKLLVTNTYYLDRVCPDLMVTPAPGSLRKFNEFGLRHHQIENGVLLAFEAADEFRTPFVQIEGEQSLSFLLTLKNSSFLNFTDLPPRNAGEIYYFDNLSGNSLQAKVMNLKPAQFRYYHEADTTGIRLSFSDAFGIKVYDKFLNSDSKIFNPAIDARSWKAGVYEVKVRAGSTLKFSEKIYVGEEIFAKGCFGIAEIFQTSTSPFDYSVETDYSIEFNAKAIPWKYLIELTRDYSSHTFLIEDKEDYSSPPADPNYPYSAEVKFVEVGPTSHGKGERAEFLTGTSAVSPIDVPLSEVPKKKLQLTLSNGGGQLVVKNLPNPSVNNVKAEVYLKI